MGSGIEIAASGAKAQMQTMDIHSNNLANISTSGFQRQTVSFQAVLSGTPAAPSKDTAFVEVAELGTDTKSGSLRDTGNPLDLALVGPGYFAFDTDRGVRYSRAGSFSVNNQNQLVSEVGDPVRMAGGGTVQIPADAMMVEFTPNGGIRADGVEIGQLELVNLDPKSLVREGDNMYSTTGGAMSSELPEVVSGAVELSNVNVVSEMVRIIKTQRVYESLMGMIKAYKQIDEKTVGTLK